MSFIATSFDDYNNNFMSYKSNFLILSISLKTLIIFTSFSFNSFIIFIINLINIILFDIISLIINLSRIFIIVNVIKIKKVIVIFKKGFNLNKKAYVNNNVEEFNLFV